MSYNYDELIQKRWRELTPDEMQWVEEKGYVNGCGDKTFGWLIPEFRFHASCNQHDWNYGRGGGVWDKWHADFQFYAAMLLDADILKQGLANRSVKIHITLATIYFIAVVLFGWRCFNWKGKRETFKNGMKAMFRSIVEKFKDTNDKKPNKKRHL